MFHQVGALSYWSSILRDFLQKTYPNRRFGGRNQHPGLRALLLLMIFFFCGYIKDRVFDTLVADVEELKVRIQAAVCIVAEDMLTNTSQELEYHLAIFWDTKEAHNEVYWGKLSYNKIVIGLTIYLNNHTSNYDGLRIINI